jgi:uridine kinase
LKSYLIGIAGLSGSGKTELARHLAPHLDAACEVITLDSYYFSQSHRTLAERAGLNFDHPDALDWTLLETHLQTLSRGEPIDEPNYLFDQHTRSPRTRRVEPKPFLILEGILALHRAEIRNILDLKVFVTTRPEECLRRRIHRDVAERGRTRESVIEQYEATVWPMAMEYVLPSRDFADIVVSGEEPLEQSIARMARHLKKTLAAAG